MVLALYSKCAPRTVLGARGKAMERLTALPARRWCCIQLGRSRSERLPVATPTRLPTSLDEANYCVVRTSLPPSAGLRDEWTSETIGLADLDGEQPQTQTPMEIV